MRRVEERVVLRLAILPLVLWAMQGGGAIAQRSAPVTLRGRVVDATGQPVVGVRLRLYRGTYGTVFHSYAVTPVGEAVAKVDGVFSFGAPAGEYLLQLATPRDRLAEWVATPVSLRLMAGQVADARIEVRKGGLLEVAVLEVGSNKPLEKAHVDIPELAGLPHPGIVSDANGVARIRLMPGRYEIRGALREGYTYEGPRQVVTAEEGATKRAVVVLTPNVQGIVRGPDGLPVAGARIRIIGAGREEATSDEQGRFEITWDRRCQFREATAFCLVARHEPQNLAATMEIHKDASSLDVKLQPCPVLTGRVIDPNGRGIAGAWAYLTLKVSNWGDTPLSEEQSEADDNGQFEIRAVPPGGQYTLHAYADAYGSGNAIVATRAVTDRPHDVGMLTLSPASLSISGRVLDPGGNPVANAMICGWGEGQPTRLNTQTDAGGRFTLDGVCAGTVDIRVDADLGGGRHLRAHVLAGAGATGLEIGSRNPFSR